MMQSKVCILKLKKEEKEKLIELLELSKNLYNDALDEYYETEEWNLYEYIKRYRLSNINFRKLNSKVSKRILSKLNDNLTSYWKSPNMLKNPIKKLDSKSYLIFCKEYLNNRLNYSQNKQYWRDTFLKENKGYIKIHSGFYLKLPYINYVINKGELREIILISYNNHKQFKIVYSYKIDELIRPLNKKVLGLDLGVKYLIAGSITEGKAFKVSGTEFTNKNFKFLHRIDKLKSVRKNQNLTYTKKMLNIERKRINYIDDYFNKLVKQIIDFALRNDITNIVVGRNKGWKQKKKLRKDFNRKFQSIPYYKLIRKLKSKCSEFGIKFIETNETYTSQASFFNRDKMYDEPIIGKERAFINFSGYRGTDNIYYTYDGEYRLCADIHGSLNIIRKVFKDFHLEKIPEEVPLKNTEYNIQHIYNYESDLFRIRGSDFTLNFLFYKVKGYLQGKVLLNDSKGNIIINSSKLIDFKKFKNRFIKSINCNFKLTSIFIKLGI